MPWSGKSFSSKHNHKLHGKSADKAAAQANAILAKTNDEGLAIATANKQASKKKTREEKVTSMYKKK